jgi:predicted ribonuclease YlaK
MFLVLDTNVLLHNFDVIKQFTADLDALGQHLLIIIPSAVLSELDA